MTNFRGLLIGKNLQHNGHYTGIADYRDKNKGFVYHNSLKNKYNEATCITNMTLKDVQIKYIDNTNDQNYRFWVIFAGAESNVTLNTYNILKQSHLSQPQTNFLNDMLLERLDVRRYIQHTYFNPNKIEMLSTHFEKIFQVLIKRNLKSYTNCGQNYSPEKIRQWRNTHTLNQIKH